MMKILKIYYKLVLNDRSFSVYIVLDGRIFLRFFLK